MITVLRSNLKHLRLTWYVGINKVRWKMSKPQKSLSALLSLCQKFSQSVEIWQSS